jgi:hypothetical protein
MLSRDRYWQQSNMAAWYMILRSSLGCLFLWFMSRGSFRNPESVRLYAMPKLEAEALYLSAHSLIRKLLYPRFVKLTSCAWTRLHTSYSTADHLYSSICGSTLRCTGSLSSFMPDRNSIEGVFVGIGNLLELVSSLQQTKLVNRHPASLNYQVSHIRVSRRDCACNGIPHTSGPSAVFMSGWGIVVWLLCRH